MENAIECAQPRRFSSGSLYVQMMSSLAAELDNMLYELGTTPAFPYGRLLEETEEEDDVDDEYR
ncbi:hypothetical protein HUJ04_009118 [Dendroctonus ponderosae]|nr:hypothetical protein HUJ04_009118 [Dendroctonus ponderosae]